MKHRTRWIAGAVAAVVVVFGVVLALNVGNDPQSGAQASPLQNRAVPAFDLPTIDGGRVNEAATTGKWTVINFWNTWCVPCREELPELRRFMRSYAGNEDVQMIGIVRDPNEPKSVIRKYVEDEGMDWTIAFDPGSKAALDFATRGQPETFLVAPNGEVVVFFYGPVTARSLERAVVAVGGPASS
jgi:cytochrome c biogenesis protein CcmG/thiol:disulfide interchange protein DsbE